MGKETGKLNNGGFDEREEMGLGCREERAQGVGSDFLLYSDRTIDLGQFVQINVIDFNGVHVFEVAIADSDGIRGRGTRVEGAGSDR